jgi:hypothetical protein
MEPNPRFKSLSLTMWAILGMMLVTLPVCGGEGCCLFGGKRGFSELDGAVRLIPVNVSCQRMLAEEQLWSGRMQVEATIYMIDALNAFAAPGKDVYLGQPLVNQVVMNHGVEYGFHATSYVLAHEYAHHFQFRMVEALGTERPVTPIMELQADILAGYWFGSRLKEQDNMLGPGKQPGEINHILQVARNAAFEVGDFAFSSPDHHGTPDQRHAAVVAGSSAGFSEKFGLSDKAYSSNERSIYSWSLAKAREIFTGDSSPDSSADRKRPKVGSLPENDVMPKSAKALNLLIAEENEAMKKELEKARRYQEKADGAQSEELREGFEDIAEEARSSAKKRRQKISNYRKILSQLQEGKE